MNINPEGLQRVRLEGAEQTAEEPARHPGDEGRFEVHANRLDLIFFGLVIGAGLIGLAFLFLY